MSDLNQFFLQCQSRIEQALEQRLPHANHHPTQLHQAMRYSVLGGGKRVRPMLYYSTAQALGIEFTQSLDTPACALELIHAYSLIHDDLPAMDDDELRRGQATCHIKYDEATAILAGDSLQTLAFQLLSHDSNFNAADNIRIKLIENLSLATGSLGMAGGQAMDLAAEGQVLSLPELENLHIHKTGALIRSSVNMAVIMFGQVHQQEKNLDHYAKCIGLAFQVQDDILDIESDTKTLGKTQGKDIAQNKATYPSLLGLAESKQMANDLLTDALDSLSGFSHEADSLRDLANYIVKRTF